ncbi:hypothetical protein Forpi1262_v018326 [Fusarium oxysporum f. sp. raphani]|uniref:HTH CENPB-type domain-containing protein n=1 Tax=Fusarium oxysporum f. sp. raphani TaxID=96318 RepID=A0A8J5NJY5_FUSOX|nr:hypothetical protein Forpi1262_v018326 [Fusarium oxysporum f. sp. raphani]
MPSIPNIKAAQAVVISRQRLQKGLSRDASNGPKKALSLRDAERRYPGSKRPSIARIIKQLEAANTLDYELVIQPNMGRPRLLSDDEDEAIVSFVMWMQKSGLPASKSEIVDAVNTIRSRRDADAKPVGKMWYRRFRDDHPELDTSILKAKEAARYEYEEAGVEETKQWFKRLDEVITRYGIGASEIWNADQAEWFGCNEHLKSPSNAAASYDKPPGTEGKAEEDLVWRLLVIDGFSGHGSFAFREYCIKFNILVAFLLPHSTHMLQPMDLGVFQWLKNAHQKRLRDALRKGNLSFNRRDFAGSFKVCVISFNRRDFAGSFKEIFDEGFTPAHIITGFEKSGIFPPTEAIDPALSSLLPAENRFPLASDTARDVSNRYHDILSSPTLRGLESVRKIVSEAIVLEDIVRNHVEDRQGRIEKRYHQRKRGKRAKPVGEYIHNVSLEELREQHTEDVNAGNKAQQRLQLRNLRSFAIQQIKEIRDEWRKKKEVIVNGVEKRLQFKQWLEHTGKDVEYASYDASRAEIRSQLNKKEDFFTIDTQLAPEAREAIRKARFADKPLSSADLSRLLCSDDTVDFTLTQAPADQDEDEDNDLSDEDDLKMPSSPPCLLDRESSLPTIPSTPCPPQHHARYDDAFINRMIEEAEALEATQAFYDEQ